MLWQFFRKYLFRISNNWRGKFTANEVEERGDKIHRSMQSLKEDGFQEGEIRKIKFLFIGSVEEKKDLLETKLITDWKYQEVNCVKDSNQWLISGWTDPKKISVSSLAQWTEEMMRLGKALNYEFVGWGIDKF